MKGYGILRKETMITEQYSSGAGIVKNHTDMSSRQTETLQKFQKRIQEWKKPTSRIRSVCTSRFAKASGVEARGKNSGAL